MNVTRASRRSIGSTFCTPRRAPVRAIGLALAVAVMMVMLAPLLAQAAAAADDEQPAGFAATTDNPVADATLVAQDVGGEGGEGEVPPAEDEEVDDVVAEQPEATPNSITVVKYYCEDDYDGDYGRLIENCHEPGDSVPFALYGDGVEEYYDGGIWTEGFYEGYFEIYEDVPVGYGAPVVYCGIFSADSAVALSSFDVSDGGIGFELDEGFSIYCAWFNVPDHEGGDATIVIYKYACPAGFAAYEAGHQEIYDTCGDTQDGVGFGIFSDEGQIASGETSSGAVEFSGLPATDLLIAEEYLDGYGQPIVFCSRTDAAGVTHETEAMTVEFSELYYVASSFDAGDILVCDWFNVPVDNHDDGTVTIIKYGCPLDLEIDPYSAYLDQLLDACVEPQDEVRFDLFHQGNPLLETRVTGFDGDPGVADWDSVAPGYLTVQEELPDGYGTPVVFCDTYYPVGEHVPEFAWIGAEGAQIEFNLGNEYALTCYWFNIPSSDGESTVTVTKWICPEGYSYDELAALDEYELHDLCVERQEHVNFALNGDGEMTDGSGQVFWGGLGLGDYELFEFIPHGYGIPIVWCGFTAFHDGAIYDAFPQPVELADGTTFAFEITIPNSEWFCNWFNIPTEHEDEPGTLIVIKYWCDGNVVSELDCAIYTGGQTFLLGAASGEGDPIEFTTGGDGSATLELPAGAWTLDEVGGEWCKAESDDVNGLGQIVTWSGHESVVKVYNCGADDVPGDDPPTKEPPVKDLPNTGSGAAALTGNGAAGSLAAAAAAAQLAGLVALAAIRGRRVRQADRISA